MPNSSHGIFRLFIACLTLFSFSCKKDGLPVDPPIVAVPDTTSHNFSWKMFLLGGNYALNQLHDVAIVNDSDIWAVGAVWNGDSLVNAVHWDGTNWEMKPIMFSGPLTGGIRYPELWAVTNLGTGKIFVSNGGVGATVEGDKVTMDIGMNAVLQGAVKKMFATSPQNIYVVGYNGAIVHYDGSKWTRMESGTRILLRDVYGTPDGKTVWACGYDTSSVLLKYDGIGWQKVWEHKTGGPLMPFYTLVTSVFATNSNLWVSGDAGIYKSPLSSDTSLVVKQPIDPIRGSHAIRGTPTGSSIAVVYEDGIIWHYNGSSWKQVRTLGFSMDYYAVAVSQHTIVAVGTNSFNGQALIFVGSH